MNRSDLLKLSVFQLAHLSLITAPLINRAPDNAGSKQKMVYSSTKISFKNKLTGIQAMLQCNDLEELSFSEVYKNAMK